MLASMRTTFEVKNTDLSSLFNNNRWSSIWIKICELCPKTLPEILVLAMTQPGKASGTRGAIWWPLARLEVTRGQEFSHRRGSPGGPGVPWGGNLCPPAGAPRVWTQTILYWEGRCWRPAGGWHWVTRFNRTGGMHKIAYLEKNCGGGELHGDCWQWNQGCKFQLAMRLKICGCDIDLYWRVVKNLIVKNNQ